MIVIISALTLVIVGGYIGWFIAMPSKYELYKLQDENYDYEKERELLIDENNTLRERCKSLKQRKPQDPADWWKE